jgi:hypothetical protein
MARQRWLGTMILCSLLIESRFYGVFKSTASPAMPLDVQNGPCQMSDRVQGYFAA